MKIGFEYDGPSAVSGVFAFQVYQGLISPWWLLLSLALLFRVPALEWKWSRPKVGPNQ